MKREIVGGEKSTLSKVSDPVPSGVHFCLLLKCQWVSCTRLGMFWLHLCRYRNRGEIPRPGSQGWDKLGLSLWLKPTSYGRTQEMADKSLKDGGESKEMGLWFKKLKQWGQKLIQRGGEEFKFFEFIPPSVKICQYHWIKPNHSSVLIVGPCHPWEFTY